MRASVIELLPDPLSPLFATLEPFPVSWNDIKRMVELTHTIGIGDELHDLEQTAFRDDRWLRLLWDGSHVYAGRDRQGAAWRCRRPVGGQIPGLLARAQERWQRETFASRPTPWRWTRRWEMGQERDHQTAPATELLDGAREIVLAAGARALYLHPERYLPSILSGSSKSLFTNVVRSADQAAHRSARADVISSGSTARRSSPRNICTIWRRGRAGTGPPRS